ncbi:RpiB/LacA/LacB family sugar-phosphate isomerase [Enterococcus pallens]|uniref:RpiB/LacA/LacB family sugar-phosphate isomerase n=1 Tax=Enterococcus pallens ATCC BAA-351 TaxID=1158607 RepID=R2SRX0_9ENTE|nr:RpiB/LacA/LacB family sugar-phosphate isomerase [Enterococcus pallens]EOH95556.1 RpiB/LacA/LacB family sugar-phosphate isomerase [Enterococcus pallens ATCC BAA-351]EOU21307.1 hypothetical protein I588_02154 [Enterococcus pallens ATCC BAA-351]
MGSKMKIIIAYDQAISQMIKGTIAILKDHGYEITDAGAEKEAIGEFTSSAKIVSEGIQSGEYQRGILFCGSGIGVCIAANKFHGVRAALAYDILPAALSVIDNNANVLCTGAWTMESDEKCAKMIETWLMVGYNNRDEKGMKCIEMIEQQF